MIPLVLRVLQPFGRVITCVANKIYEVRKIVFGKREPGMMPFWMALIFWILFLPARIISRFRR